MQENFLEQIILFFQEEGYNAKEGISNVVIGLFFLLCKGYSGLPFLLTFYGMRGGVENRLVAYGFGFGEL